MKHTGGAWFYNPDFSAVIVIRGHEVRTVADFGKVDLPETEANAKLMSAAPELLEALKELQKQIFARRKMNVKKDYSMLVADAAAGKAVFKAEGGIEK